MLSLYEILKASKTGIAPDMWTALAGSGAFSDNGCLFLTADDEVFITSDEEQFEPRASA